MTSDNYDCLLMQMCSCAIKNDITKETFNLAPYLYPLTIEFSILIGELNTTSLHVLFCPT